MFTKEEKSIINKIEKLIKSETNDIEIKFQTGKLLSENSDKIDNKKFYPNASEYFGDKKGFSESNLRAMYQFYNEYSNFPELYKLAVKIGWSHNRTIMTIENLKEREFYLKLTIANSLSEKDLKNKITEKLYEKYISDLETFTEIPTLKEIKFRNFKSLNDVTILNPNRFTVFAGANSSGKSNIFEAIEMLFQSKKYETSELVKTFGGEETFVNYSAQKSKNFDFLIQLNFQNLISISLSGTNNNYIKNWTLSPKFDTIIFDKFSKLFIKNNEEKSNGNAKLNFNASNLHEILRNILSDQNKKEQILEQIKLFIPGFSDIRIEINPVNNSYQLNIYENKSDKPFSGKLISDGTYNLLALLSVIYQSDKPQFILIEEPENGINPKVLKEFVQFFRNVCKDEGHYIWLTTHSQTIVSELNTDELILVDKINGKTVIKQFRGEDYKDIRLDDAWLNGLLEGGLPW
jgi:predicted ATPase